MTQYLVPAVTDDEASFFDAPNLTGTPERRLLLAILERAILDYVGNDEKEVEDAREWLFGDSTEVIMGHFSFAWVCQELDLDRERVADTVLAMPRRGDRRIAPWYFAKAN